MYTIQTLCRNFRTYGKYGAFLCCFLMVASCTDDVLENTNKSFQQGLNVKFKVGEIQNGLETNNSKQDYQNEITQPYSNAPAGETVSSADLKHGLLKTTGTASARISMTETTLVNAETGTSTDLTRANITTMATLGNFSSTAYRGSNSGQLDECWFYNEETDKQGNLIQPIQWELAKPYATFYAVYPKPDNSNNALSPRGQALPPYIDFCVEPKVTEQVDLMAACSGEIHLDNASVAPEVFLRFRHALTGIRFKAGAGLTIDKTITKVEILNALSKGRYTLPANGSKYGKWEELSTPANFVLDNINVKIKDAVNNIIIGKNNDNYIFYMMPQRLNGVVIKVHFSDGTFVESHPTQEWKAGTIKTYELNDKNFAKDFTYELSVTPPATLYYNETECTYKVTSYRNHGDTRQVVKWHIVGYDANGDGEFSMNEKPQWLGNIEAKGEGSLRDEEYKASLISGVDKGADEYSKQLRQAASRGSKSEPYDLSKFNYKGEATSMNTANSYLISAPGYYKLPLVYGNAIEQGNINTKAYTSSKTGEDILTVFKDHADKDITSPYINEQNVAKPATQASLVWADAKGVVKVSPRIVGSGKDAYLVFQVPAQEIKNANAVVAVKNEDGEVMWSWHLWLAPTEVLRTITCTNRQGKQYKFTKEPLGMKNDWTVTSYTKRKVKVKIVQDANVGKGKEAEFVIEQNPVDRKRSYANFYQFGRKDPLLGSYDYKEGDEIKHNIAEGTFSYDSSRGGHTLGYAIQHPEYMLGSADSEGYMGWCKDIYKNLWSADNTSTEKKDWHNDNPVVKTIYDPCPVGFKIPASNAFTGFADRDGFNTSSTFNAKGEWNEGLNFYSQPNKNGETIYFPAWGIRTTTKGIHGGVGIYGAYWTAVAAEPTQGCCMLMYSLEEMKVVVPTHVDVKAWGFFVRPVAE